MTEDLAIRGFPTKVASRVSGVPMPTLHSWVHSGFIAPSIMGAAGTGIVRVWSFRDLVALRTARRLRDAGVSLQSLRKAVAALRGFGIDGLASARLVISGEDVLLAHGDAELGAQLTSLLRHPGQRAMHLVVIADVIRELEEALAA